MIDDMLKEEKNKETVCIETTFFLVCTMAQSMCMLMSESKDASTRKAANSLIQAVALSLRMVHGEKYADRIIDAWTGGAYSKAKDLVDSGLTVDQAVDFFKKGNKYDA